MNIKPIGKSFFQLRNIGHMGQHAKFKLRIICTDKFVALACDESRADAAAIIRAHWNVLKIGIR